MRSITPDFYDKFNCKAGDCNHSCCKGWEIDIDEDSYTYYCSINSAFGEKIRANTFTDEEGAHFKLTANDRCPFLQKDGLCEMILTIGEESLCDICALHPRFYEDYDLPSNSDDGSFEAVELAGVGLSCEKVCELLWNTDKPLKFQSVDSEVNFTFQKKSYLPTTDFDHILNLLSLFEKTEPIDEDWTSEMKDLISHVDEAVKKATAYATSYDKGRYTRLLHYIAFRQLEAMEDSQKLLDFATRCTDFVFLTDAYYYDVKNTTVNSRSPHTLECIRRFSEQIEYSTENVAIIAEADTL